MRIAVAPLGSGWYRTPLRVWVVLRVICCPGRYRVLLPGSFWMSRLPSASYRKELSPSVPPVTAVSSPVSSQLRVWLP
ncbi:hypothetical protein AWV63_24845 [Micromonospora rifamycinica]|nr:hypothetical protein AWV63_24845 [Micromonospora rifamycinica]